MITKTAREKAEKLCKDLYLSNSDIILNAIITLLREQDRDTRLACCEAIREVDLRCPGPRLALADAILNTHITKGEQDGKDNK